MPRSEIIAILAGIHEAVTALRGKPDRREGAR